MGHKQSETAIPTQEQQEQCRRWCQGEIAQRDRELLAIGEHQELLDKERYKELKDHFNQRGSRILSSGSYWQIFKQGRLQAHVTIWTP
eukprot:11091961-Prorocentrum_lima.AAC.1